jgi:nucleotide-binding universal stress UspA family protein
MLFSDMQERSILVPYDGQKHSEKALRRAIDFAKSMNKELVLFKVVPNILADEHLVRLRTPERQKIADEINEESKKVIEREQSLLARKAQSIENEGVKASAMVAGGDPADEIIKMAHTMRPFMVVMGSRKLVGLGTLKKLGSVTRRVAENVDSGLFIIR